MIIDVQHTFIQKVIWHQFSVETNKYVLFCKMEFPMKSPIYIIAKTYKANKFTRVNCKNKRIMERL